MASRRSSASNQIESETKLLARFHHPPTQLRGANYKWPWRIRQTAGAVRGRHGPEYSRVIFPTQKLSQSAPQNVAGLSREEVNPLTRA